eukprot:3933575-Rhodomonas_salina.1
MGLDWQGSQRESGRRRRCMCLAGSTSISRLSVYGGPSFSLRLPLLKLVGHSPWHVRRHLCGFRGNAAEYALLQCRNVWRHMRCHVYAGMCAAIYSACAAIYGGSAAVYGSKADICGHSHGTGRVWAARGAFARRRRPLWYQHAVVAYRLRYQRTGAAHTCSIPIGCGVFSTDIVYGAASASCSLLPRSGSGFR